MKKPSEADKVRIEAKRKKEEEKIAEEDISRKITKKQGEGEGEGEDEDEDIPTKLPKGVKFMPCEDEFYPAEFNGIVYDCYKMRVVFDREKTGFEETREF